MSNHLSIAAVTAVFQQLLQSKIDLEGLTIKVGTPDAPTAEGGNPLINLCLYQVSPNTAFQNMDLATRDSKGKLLQQPFLALDLYYLLTFYGDGQSLVPEQLLGKVLQTMYTYPVLSKDAVKNVLSALTKGQGIYQFLLNSDLADTMPKGMYFTLQSTSLEELTKLWSAFFMKIPYTLSVAYRVSAVLINADLDVQPAPRVEDINNVHLDLQPSIPAKKSAKKENIEENDPAENTDEQVKKHD
jgi:Pvc16 N-terminal domain